MFVLDNRIKICGKTQQVHLFEDNNRNFRKRCETCSM